MQPLDAFAASKCFGMGDEQTPMALPLAARKHDQRAQQAVRAFTFQPDEADWTLIIGQLEEFTCRLVDVAEWKLSHLERKTKDVVAGGRQRGEN